ncbi:ribonuclease H-like domain-containing protein [Vararia minispora EC-137]|uniref:Ribonuclease H-like domain-containing protein n=1 Tax=Vararia minispora EC-137 TaxID=1314806 RepID=A0ACB8QYU5_9AGAM|nr:ribonuclease H-like domain-containing protein [Vararia minispora EC-137]
MYSYQEYIPRPPVVYVRREEEVNEVLEDLSGPLGFDLEWKVINKNGHRVGCPAALVQISDGSIILLIQVTAMERIPSIPKLGVNIRNDALKLYRDYGIVARNIVELGALGCAVDPRFASIYDRSIVALAKVVAFYLHRSLDKGPVRTSDWERELTKDQIVYAANDAHCAVMVYRRIMAIARASKVKLHPSTFTSDLAQELESSSTEIHKSLYVTSTARLPASSAKRQHFRAYSLWRAGHGLLDICIKMRNAKNPLHDATVITYIVSALAEDPSLPFCMKKLQSLVKGEATSWHSHKDVILAMGQVGRGND